MGLCVFQAGGRWRGIMPFRHEEPFNSERRTGEPSPAPWYPPGYGKSEGSFTRQLQGALIAWMKTNYGTAYHSLTFEYRLYRHRIVAVVGYHPAILHLPSWGNGVRGFVLEVNVSGIDGVQWHGLGRRQRFAWNRIVGKDRILALRA